MLKFYDFCNILNQPIVINPYMNNDKMNALELPFKDKLYRFALNIVGNTFDAEDIMQELMIKIWNRMDQYTLIENKEAWCMTVTRNMCIDKVRNKKTSA